MQTMQYFHGFVMAVFFNWDSLHVGLNRHCEAWSCEKKKHKRLMHTANVKKESTVKRGLLILDLKPFKSYVKGKRPTG